MFECCASVLFKPGISTELQIKIRLYFFILFISILFVGVDGCMGLFDLCDPNISNISGAL